MPRHDTCDLTGRVSLITGAQRGIGFAIASAFARAGSVVALADLPGSAVASARDRLEESGHSAHEVDVSDRTSVGRVVTDVVAAHGRIDCVVNSAAILEVSSFLDLEVESWDRTIAVNLRGTFLVCQESARVMAAAGNGGRIIAIASNVGRIPRMNNAAYASSKAAVIHLVRAMALELSRYGISVNALCPGSTATGMLVDIQAGSDPDRLDGIVKGSLEQWRTGIPLGRLAEPEDQAAMAVFLASDGGAFVNGQALCVDGGQTLF
jgi:2,3-dihydro-2,3-dihydroxybenzoate dehydrogenase